uniref:C2H2-type domain-containing protein n=1 Tax=Strigamia maritima TaxID=126957 RepID=T1IKV9_STRMM
MIHHQETTFTLNHVYLKCSAENCNYQSYRQFNLDRHFAKMHNQPKKMETCCDLNFPTKFEYFQHVKSHHADGYHCPVEGCDLFFQKKVTLERHSTVHTGIKNIHCDTCHYRTSHAFNMKRHCLKKVHKCSNEKVFLTISRNQMDRDDSDDESDEEMPITDEDDEISVDVNDNNDVQSGKDVEIKSSSCRPASPSVVKCLKTPVRSKLCIRITNSVKKGKLNVRKEVYADWPEKTISREELERKMLLNFPI